MGGATRSSRSTLFAVVGSLDLLSGLVLLVVSSTDLGRFAGGVVAVAGLTMLILATQRARHARRPFR